MNRIVTNLKKDCCTDSIFVFSNKATYKNEDKVKLYHTKNDACDEGEKFDWYPVPIIVELNNASNRKEGIICHQCADGKCILSLIIQPPRPNPEDKRQNTRFCVANKIEIK